MLTIRHLNRPGVLAHVFETLGRSGHNVEEMENVIYQGGEAAVARIQIGGVLTADQRNAIESHEHVLGATVSPITHS